MAFWSVVMAIAFVAATIAVVVMAVPESVAAIMVAASPTGAAWTEFAATALAIAVADSVIPLLVKKFRNFSTPRFTRIRAASSVVPITAPTSLVWNIVSAGK